MANAEESISSGARPGVLIDLDGTLVDTNYLHTLAWARALEDAGEWAPMTAIHHLIGMGAERLVRELLGHDNAAAIEARPRRYRELLGEAKAFPGARETLTAWHNSGLVIVVASSSPRDEVDVMLQLLDAASAIDATTSADDVDRAKPNPELFEAALRAGSVDRDRAVVVGDSVWDSQAARHAGLPMLAVETGGTGAEALLRGGARRVYRDVGEMREVLSPSTVEQLCVDRVSRPERHLTGAAQAAVNRELDPPA